MKKTLLLGVLVQAVLLVAALVMEDWQVLVKGNMPVLMIGFIAMGATSKGANGWEFVGTNEKEKQDVFSYRSRILLKWLLFLLPGLLVLLGYYLVFRDFSMIITT